MTLRLNIIFFYLLIIILFLACPEYPGGAIDKEVHCKPQAQGSNPTHICVWGMFSYRVIPLDIRHHSLTN